MAAPSVLGSLASNSNQNVNKTVSVSHTLQSGDNRAVVIIVHWAQSGITVNTVTYGGVTVTQGSAQAGSAYYFTQVFVLFEEDLPADGAQTATLTLSANSNKKSIQVIAFQDAAQVIDDSDTATASAANVTTTQSISDDDSVVISGALGTNAAYTYTHSDNDSGSAVTELYDYADGYRYTGAYALPCSAAGSHTFTHTASSSMNQAAATVVIGPASVAVPAPSDIQHDNTVDRATLTQQNNVSVAELSHAHEIEGARPAAGPIVGELLSAHIIDKVTPTQDQFLTVSNIAHGHPIARVGLYQTPLHTILMQTSDATIKLLSKEADVVLAGREFTVKFTRYQYLTWAVPVNIGHAHTVEPVVIS